jgi:hypothetical protein
MSKDEELRRVRETLNADLKIASERVLTLELESNRQRKLLRRCFTMLVLLGDFIGNGELDPVRVDSLGIRCDLIGDIKTSLEE